MDVNDFETAAFVLMALALPLISFGATGGTALWVVGFVLLAVGALIPPTLRFAGPEATA